MYFLLALVHEGIEFWAREVIEKVEQLREAWVQCPTPHGTLSASRYATKDRVVLISGEHSLEESWVFPWNSLGMTNMLTTVMHNHPQVFFNWCQEPSPNNNFPFKRK